MSSEEEGITVNVTSKGQATIPKEFRDKLRIGTPGKVRFVETDDGEVLLRPIERPSEIRGELASGADGPEQSATKLLREQRERDEDKTSRAVDERTG